MDCGGAAISFTMVAMLSSCVAQQTGEVGVEMAAIVGGETVADGDWPSIGHLAVGCSSVLIQPDLIVYAAHCGVAHDAVRWEDASDSITEIVECVAHPEFEQVVGADIAYCLLREPQPQRQPIPPAADGDWSSIMPGTSAVLIGFGGDGIKMAVTAPIGEVDEELTIGDSAHGTCDGDSGGPALVAVDDASNPWRVAGVLSSGLRDACGVGYYSSLHATLSWLELSTGRKLGVARTWDRKQALATCTALGPETSQTSRRACWATLACVWVVAITRYGRRSRRLRR